MNLQQLNQLDEQSAQQWFLDCCAALKWAQSMAAARPYQTVEQIENYACLLWEQLSERDYRQAFEAHPMIGDVKSLQQKFASTREFATQEQSAVKDADPQVLVKLHQLNQRYLHKNGFIFIICATGLSADTMLEALEKRIQNSSEQEVTIAAEQQLQITLLRIRKNLTS